MSMYNFAFVNNAATIFIYKSRRKNSKIEKAIHVNHLITHGENRKISDERIISHFVDVCEFLQYYAKGKEEIDISVNMDIFRNVIKENGEKTDRSYFYTEKEIFSGKYALENCFIWIFNNVFCAIYPYNEIDFDNVIKHNPSIKAFYKNGR